MLEGFIRPPFDFEIPDYLQTSIDGLIKAIDEDKYPFDCEMSDTAASVNMAFSCKQITKQQADWLRDYYGFGGLFEDVRKYEAENKK